ncbi:hypothetical protein QG37_06840 [Candidozyma auris]|nr:hypothetical protein QG37_06840 [[Candida] auris]
MQLLGGWRVGRNFYRAPQGKNKKTSAPNGPLFVSALRPGNCPCDRPCKERLAKLVARDPNTIRHELSCIDKKKKSQNDRFQSVSLQGQRSSAMIGNFEILPIVQC